MIKVEESNKQKSSANPYQDIWEANKDILKGLQFSATLSLRTPLRVLLRHGEIYQGDGEPPEIARDGSEGIWLGALDSPFDFLSRGAKMSSEIGPVPTDGGRFLKDLIRIREIIESYEPIEKRVSKLKSKLYPGSKERRIEDVFFPYFLETLPGLNEATISELRNNSLETPQRLMDASDTKLLSIKGIGPAKLKKIREMCEIEKDKQAVRVDLVNR